MYRRRCDSLGLILKPVESALVFVRLTNEDIFNTVGIHGGQGDFPATSPRSRGRVRRSGDHLVRRFD